MMDDYYTIQTQNHHSSLFTELHFLQKQGVMCDIILAADDGEVLAHKVVLMAASKYFRDKLSPIVSQQSPKICLKGISVVELANLVKYIYTGKLVVAKETMDITLEISEILELKGVIQGYQEILSYETLRAAGALPAPGQMHYNTDVKVAFPPAPISGQDVHMSQSHEQVAQTGVSAESLQAPQTNIPMKNNEEVTSLPVTADVNTSQSSSNEYNFDIHPFDQYVDISVEPNTPTKNLQQYKSSPVVTPPKLQQMANFAAAESQKIAEEQAQHQDLLAVAIETLSDTSSLMNTRQRQKDGTDTDQAKQRQTGGTEIDKAVSSITIASQAAPQAAEATPRQSEENLEKPDLEGELEPFINGKTSTKTVTLNAGIVANELGGQTEVYTVSLDPQSIKGDLHMPRPMKRKSDKEKKAQETAKTYRQKKADLINTAKPAEKEKTDAVVKTPKRDKPKGNPTKKNDNQQDFRFASPSKQRKKGEMPKIVLSPKGKSSKPDHETKTVNEKGDNKKQEQTEGIKACSQTIVNEVKKSINETESPYEKGDNKKQDRTEGIKASSRTIVNEVKKTTNETESANEVEDFGQVVNFDDVDDEMDDFQVPPEPVKSNGKIEGNAKEIKKERLSVENKTGKEDGTSPAKAAMNISEDIVSPKSPNMTSSEDRSSSKKRKNRTPKKMSHEEGSFDRRPGEKIPLVRTRRYSKTENGNGAKTGGKPKVKSSGTEKLDGTECTEGIVEKVVEKVKVRRSSNNSKSDKQILKLEKEMKVETPDKSLPIKVPKGMLPQVRLRKRTSEEMNELVKSVRKTSKDASTSIDYQEVGEVLLDGENFDEFNSENSGDTYDEDAIFSQVLQDINADQNQQAMEKAELLKRKQGHGSEYLKDKETGTYQCGIKGCKAAFDDIRYLKLHRTKVCQDSSPRKDKRNIFDILNESESVTKDGDGKKSPKSPKKQKTVNNIKASVEVDTEMSKVPLKKKGRLSKVAQKEQNSLESNTTVTNTKIGAQNVSPEITPDPKSKMTGRGKRKMKEIKIEDGNMEVECENKHTPDKKVKRTEAARNTGDKDRMIYICTEEDCMFSSPLLGSIKKHRTMFHKMSTTPVIAIGSAEAAKRRFTCMKCDFAAPTQESLDEHGISVHPGEPVLCETCEAEFESIAELNEHQKEYEGDDGDSSVDCSQGEQLENQPVKKGKFSCEFCPHTASKIGVLRRHVRFVHKLDTVTKHMMKNKKYSHLEVGTYLNQSGELFDPLTMKLPVVRKLRGNGSRKMKFDNDRKRTRISLSNLPIEEFCKELLKRHEENSKKPVKDAVFMSESIAKATCFPSFPQASPSVRNSRANKLYNMPRIKPHFEPVSSEPLTYTVGQSSMTFVPRMDNEVEVNQNPNLHADVVIENVAGLSHRPGSTILKLLEQRPSKDSEQMIIINSNGVQSIVRSKDFYQTLLEAGQESNQTLEVISSLLEAGEEIEIREEGETVEIQNI